MFNPANLANEVFGILHSFDYVVNIFDFDGNRVYEPSEARRFFASPKNITVSIHEDGENSSIKMFLSKSIDISEVSGLISTMRSTASKFGVLFNVRKYERELKPKDLAPNGASDFDAGVALSTAEHPETTDDHKSGEIEFNDTHDHDPEGNKLDRITGEVSDLTKNFKEIVGLLHSKKVKESMTTENTTLNEAEGDTIDLGILGVKVEKDAWDAFAQKNGSLPLAGKPNLNVDDTEAQHYITSYEAAHDGAGLDHDAAIKAVQITRVAAAIKGTAPLLAAAFHKALELFVTGSAPRVIDSLVNKAIDTASYGTDEAVPGHDGKTPEKRDMVKIKEFGGQVERQAWQDFVNDHIDFSDSVDFGSVKLGATANKMAIFLNLVAAKTKAAGLANLFSSFATDIEEGRASAFKQKVAKHAIEIAQHGKVEVGESVIMTQSIREFAEWFDGLASSKLFEGYYTDDPRYDDKHDRAFDLAWKTTKENFHPEAFLDEVGKHDFNWGDDSLSEEEKTVEYDYVKSSLVHYIQGELDNALEDEYPATDDAKNLADDFMPDVIQTMADAGWTVEVKADEPEGEAKVEETAGPACECIEECDCDKGETVEAGDELSTEDVLLPSRADDDFADEVTAHHDTDEMDRIIALSRGPNAAWSPRTPQP